MPDEPTIRLLLRLTARLSCLLFLAAFAGASLQAVWPSELTLWLRSHRPHFLIAFAASHTLHLGGILLLMLAQRAVFFRAKGTTEVLIVGGGIFIGIYALAFSALAEVRGRGPILRSGRVESFLMYALWIIFALAFIPRAIHGWWVYGALSLAVLAALAIRLLARFDRTTQARSASA